MRIKISLRERAPAVIYVAQGWITFWSSCHLKAHLLGCSFFCLTQNLPESPRMKFPEDFYERVVLCVICVLSAVRFTKDLCVFGSHKSAFIYLSSLPPLQILLSLPA